MSSGGSQDLGLQLEQLLSSQRSVHDELLRIIAGQADIVHAFDEFRDGGSVSRVSTRSRRSTVCTRRSRGASPDAPEPCEVLHERLSSDSHPGGGYSKPFGCTLWSKSEAEENLAVSSIGVISLDTIPTYDDDDSDEVLQSDDMGFHDVRQSVCTQDAVTAVFGKRSPREKANQMFGEVLVHSRKSLGDPCSCCAKSQRLTRIVESSYFGIAVSIVIVANMAFMAYESDWAMAHLREPPNRTLHNVDLAFCVIFITELCMKFLAYRRQFFCGRLWMWNAFDVVLVATAVHDQLIRLGGFVDNPATNLAFLRALRFLRMARTIRIVKVFGFFRELRLITLNVLASLKSTIWAIGLVLMITFMFALAFVQGATSFLQSGTPTDDLLRLEIIDRWGAPTDDLLRLEIMDRWGSTRAAMLTLYKAGTGGNDWQELATSLPPIGDGYYALFLLYISFFMFVVTNVVTSLFVDHALHASRNDEAAVIADHMSKKQEYVQAVRGIYGTMAKGPDGKVSVEEFREHLDDNAMIAFAARLEIEPHDLEQFFMTLSGAGKHGVDLETFVVGCIKLRGHARSIDIMDLLIGQQHIHDEHMSLRRACEKQFKEIRNKVHIQKDFLQECAEVTTILNDRLGAHVSLLDSHTRKLEIHHDLMHEHTKKLEFGSQD